MARLMRFEEPERQAVLEAHLRAFRQLLGPEGTLFVPTASLNLCNTEAVFDKTTTPSSDMGIFSEYVRMQPGAIRSLHPFWSVAGLGPAAPLVLEKISRHAYGWGSVFHRFVEADVLAINVGKPPAHAIPVVHHVETVIGVPYRYTKEFLHLVRCEGEVRREPFYLSVLYRDVEFARDRNRKIMARFEETGGLHRVTVGRGNAWSFSHRSFFESATALMRDDIYAWLESPPAERPFQR